MRILFFPKLCSGSLVISKFTYFACPEFQAASRRNADSHLTLKLMIDVPGAQTLYWVTVMEWNEQGYIISGELLTSLRPCYLARRLLRKLCTKRVFIRGLADIRYFSLKCFFMKFP